MLSVDWRLHLARNCNSAHLAASSSTSSWPTKLDGSYFMRQSRNCAYALKLRSPIACCLSCSRFFFLWHDMRIKRPQYFDIVCLASVRKSYVYVRVLCALHRPETPVSLRGKNINTTNFATTKDLHVAETSGKCALFRQVVYGNTHAYTDTTQLTQMLVFNFLSLPVSHLQV